MSKPIINAEIPEKLEPLLFTPARYKIVKGGRGSGKSWGVARALTIKAATEPKRILCARELQNSIEESVHKLLAVQIEELRLSSLFNIQQRSIVCKDTKSEFIFEGIKFNVNKIKSMEGIDIAWVEEAQTVTENSWQVLVPTIRKDGSEIWVTYNPDLVDDATHQRFVAQPQDNSIVIDLNWSDNPWFPRELEAEMLALKKRDYTAYLNVWEGHCRSQVSNPLWVKDTIEGCRIPMWRSEEERRALIETFTRIVVAVDPSGCHGPDDKRSDEIGIVVAGVTHSGQAIVLEDRSGRYSPEGWAREAVAAYRFWNADRIVAEKNYGGALVAATIRSADASVPVREVDATRGKVARAEPVAALYEQGKVKHLGYFAELERQMLLFATSGYKGPKSPDRADALVWALTELMLAEQTTGLIEYYKQQVEQRNAERGQTNTV